MDKLTLMVGGVVIAGAAAIWFNSTQGQSPVRQGMVPTDTSGIAEGAPIANVKLPAQFSALARIGKVAFDAKCAVCHGENAAGRNGAAPPLVYKFYETRHHGDQAFQRAAKMGVQSHHWNFGNMPPVKGLTVGDVKGIVAYVRALQRENGIY